MVAAYQNVLTICDKVLTNSSFSYGHHSWLAKLLISLFIYLAILEENWKRKKRNMLRFLFRAGV